VSVSADPRIGSELLGYRIEALIGRGGMSVVYRATDLHLKRKVALKLLASELAVDDRFRERFLRESQLAASIDHPHIIPIYEAGESDGQLYIAMRYVEGSDLKRLLREEGRLEPRRALQLLAQLADALDAAHRSGLVHRDVKPSNALLDSAEHVYLADFGLTKSASDRSAQTITGRIIGTVDYAAPEQIQGNPVDGRADVYSLGCLLYECLTGEVPFLHDSELAVLWGHVHEQPPEASERNPDLPEAIDSVITTALAKSPEKRYETCAELAEAARDALGLRDVLVVRDRRPLLLAALGVLVAAGALAAGLALTLGGGGGGKPKPDLTVRNNTVVRVDPETNRITAVVRVGQGPLSIGAAGRTVWVYNEADRTVSRIDTRTNVLERTQSISGVPPFLASNNWMAADADGAWVLSSASGKGLLTHVRPVLRQLEFPFNGDPVAVALGENALWVAVKKVLTTAVLHIDPRTGSVVARVPLRGNVRGSATDVQVPDIQSLAVGEVAVWAMQGGPQGGRIVRIEPGGGQVTGSLNLDANNFWQVAAGNGAVWAAVTKGAQNRLLVIDPRKLRVTKTFTVPNIGFAGPESLTLARGATWWNNGLGTLLRIDAQTRRVVSRIPITAEPTSWNDFLPIGAATGDGDVWLTIRVPP
jgi:tRNA A-37 threonylcarbamoyl transferase component Bud32/DNA-binding beta-propeller fold protein YncE